MVYTLDSPSPDTFENLHFSYPHPRLVVCTSGTASYRVCDGTSNTLTLQKGQAVYIAASAFFRSLNDSDYSTLGILLRDGASDLFLNNQEHQHQHRSMERCKHHSEPLTTWFHQLDSAPPSQKALLAQLILNEATSILENNTQLEGARGKFEQILGEVSYQPFPAEASN